MIRTYTEWLPLQEIAEPRGSAKLGPPRGGNFLNHTLESEKGVAKEDWLYAIVLNQTPTLEDFSLIIFNVSPAF